VANRRMFSKVVTNSDRFLALPVSSQALYFHLGMNADDDGFVEPHFVMRLVGSNPDDFNVLALKQFVIPFEDGVIVIKDWKVNNEIRVDRYKETFYLEHKKRLLENRNKQYELDGSTDGSTSFQPKVGHSGDIGDTQVRLGKDSIPSTSTSRARGKAWHEAWEKVIGYEITQYVEDSMQAAEELEEAHGEAGLKQALGGLAHAKGNPKYQNAKVKEVANFRHLLWHWDKLQSYMSTQKLRGASQAASTLRAK